MAFAVSVALVLAIVGVAYGRLFHGMSSVIHRPELQARLNALVVRSGVAAAGVAVLLLTVLCAFVLWRASRPNRVLLGLADAAILIMLLLGPALTQSILSDRSALQDFMSPWVGSSPLFVTLPSTAAAIGALVFWLTAGRRCRPVEDAA